MKKRKKREQIELLERAIERACAALAPFVGELADPWPLIAIVRALRHDMQHARGDLSVIPDHIFEALAEERLRTPSVHGHSTEAADRAALVILANRAGRLSRKAGAPVLRATSSAEEIAAWLQWNDPNGAHTAERARAEDCDPYDDARAWQALAKVIADE